MRSVLVRFGLPVALTALLYALAREGVPSLILGWGFLAYLGWHARRGVAGDVRRLWAAVSRRGRPRIVRPDRVGDL